MTPITYSAVFPICTQPLQIQANGIGPTQPQEPQVTHLGDRVGNLEPPDRP
jgi:hypothetical protein